MIWRCILLIVDYREASEMIEYSEAWPDKVKECTGAEPSEK